MKQRKHAEEHVLGGEVEIRILPVNLLRHARGQTLVREDHSLRQARGAGGKRQRHGVIRMNLHLGSVALVRLREHGEVEAILRRIVDGHDLEVLAEAPSGVVAAELFHVHCLRYDQLRLGGGELLEDLGGGVERVGGGGYSSDHGGGEEGEDELGGVLEEDHDDVALADSEIRESGSDLARNKVRLCVGVGFGGGADDEAGTVCKLGEVLEAVIMEG